MPTVTAVQALQRFTSLQSSSPRVVVLMSTYCGERFVTEQLRSILSQLRPDGRVLIRDDGSRDRTAEVIESLHDPRVTLTRGQNLGFSRSFLTLLAAAPAEADMVMFADQDDVWLPGKIDRAWRHLQALGDVPGLYGSAQMLVDVNLRPLHCTPELPRGPSFANALTQNIITGCTAAINRPAVELLQRGGVVEGVRMHDWWVYLVVSAFGRVVVDPEPSLLYRQHGGNQIGHGAGRLGRLSRMLRFLMRNDWVGILLLQVQALLQLYGDCLDPAAKDLVTRHFRIRRGTAEPRWRLVFSTRCWSQTLPYELALRLLLALHRLQLWPPRARQQQQQGSGGATM